MRAVSVASDFFDFSTHFVSFRIISLITLLFLLLDTFSFFYVVDKYPAFFRLRFWHLGRQKPPTDNVNPESPNLIPNRCVPFFSLRTGVVVINDWIHVSLIA